MEWIRGQLWEIEKSASLRIFGGILALANALTFLSWNSHGQLPLKLYSEAPMCWTLFENCLALRIVPFSVFSGLYYFYFALSLITAVMFFFTRAVAVNWSLLFALLLLKSFIYFQDFRLSLNIHYFLLCLQFLYLFVPSKRNVLLGFIVSYYFASGLLKLSPEWLTGQWFIQHKPMKIKLAEWLAAVSILIEMIGAASLLFKRGKYFLLGFLALFVYHGVFWWLEGFFPSLVYMMILLFFWLQDWESRKFESEYLYLSYLRPEPSNAWVVVVLSLFWVIQIFSIMAPSQAKARQTFDAFALDRLASNQECRLTTFAQYEDRTEQIQIAIPSGRPVQMLCNPYMRFLDIKRVCVELQKQKDFRHLAAYFEVRGLRDVAYHHLFEVSDFCNNDVKFRGTVAWNMTPTDK